MSMAPRLSLLIIKPEGVGRPAAPFARFIDPSCNESRGSFAFYFK